MSLNLHSNSEPGQAQNLSRRALTPEKEETFAFFVSSSYISVEKENKEKVWLVEGFFGSCLAGQEMTQIHLTATIWEREAAVSSEQVSSGITAWLNVTVLLLIFEGHNISLKKKLHSQTHAQTAKKHIYMTSPI